MSNPRVVVSEMAESNLQELIYYINHFKRIWRTYTHDDVELPKVRAIYCQKYMEEAHKDPEVVPTADPKY